VLVAGFKSLPVKIIVREIQRSENRMLSETNLAGSSEGGYGLKKNCFAHNDDDDDDDDDVP
jgi:hypothetical protein